MAKKQSTDRPEAASGEQKGAVNKSKAVREYMKLHPRAKPIEIAQALQQQGIDITPAHVSTIRTQSKKKRKARRQAVKEVVEKRGVGIPEIKAALGLLKVCGSAAEAREALAAAQEIRQML